MGEPCVIEPCYVHVFVLACMYQRHLITHLLVTFRLTRPSSLDAIHTSSQDDLQSTRAVSSGISGQDTEPPVASSAMSSSDMTSQDSAPASTDQTQDKKC